MIDHLIKKNVLQIVYWLKERGIPKDHVVACFNKIIEIAYEERAAEIKSY